MEIKVDTGLKGQFDKSILDSILGQLSDGYWENSSRMEKYWKNLDVELENDKVMIVAPNYYRMLFGWNDENDIKKFFARCLKTFVKHAIDDFHWASEWSRTCEDTLLGFHDRNTRVKDVYRVYDKLLNRKERVLNN